jgi:type I restriction enzyme, S subunit
MKHAWPVVNLDSVIILNRSGFWGDSEASESRPNPVKVIRNSDVSRSGGLSGFAKRYFSDKELSVARLFANDIALSTSGDVGKVYEVNEEGFCASNFIRILRPSPTLLAPGFLRLALATDGVQRALAENTTGTTIQNLQRAFFTRAMFPLPPLTEQTRLTRLLDEAFARAAVAQANIELNLKNARTIFASHLQAIFKFRSKGWMERKLGQIAEFKNGLNFTRGSTGQSLPIVGVGDFQSNNVVPLHQLRTATIDGNLTDEYVIQCGDILTVRSNGSKDLVGRCMLVPAVSQTTSFSGFIIRIRVNPAMAFPPFLLYFMKSSATRSRLTRDGGGANINNINQAKLSALPIFLPPIAEQKAIVGQLDTLAAKTQRLTQLYEKKRTALVALKKSLLHQAFSGAL